MRVGLATIQAGRRDHLARQAAAVTGTRGLDRYVVISMDPAPPSVPGGEVVHLPSNPRALPLAAARNRALSELEDLDLAILIDVDCIPDANLVDRYRAAAEALGDRALLCGPVGYLEAASGGAGLGAEACRRARRGVKRPFPAGGVERQPRPELFWSLSFAVTPTAHQTIGGFDVAYTGYGAEDTDYARRAERAGVGLWFVGGAWAYHQFHPPSAATPQLANIVANARRYHDRWGQWPMGTWLGQFAAQGLIAWTPEGDRCELSAPGSVRTPAARGVSCGRASCS